MPSPLKKRKKTRSYGDGTFPKTAEKAIAAMTPGETRLGTTSLKGTAIGDVVLDRPEGLHAIPLEFLTAMLCLHLQLALSNFG